MQLLTASNSRMTAVTLTRSCKSGDKDTPPERRDAFAIKGTVKSIFELDAEAIGQDYD